MNALRIVFMGTPAYAVPSLEALMASRHRVICVYSQPPRPRGRGQAPRASPIAARAESIGLPVRTPASLKRADEQAAFAALDADLGVTVAYGLILPAAILAAPRLGCINAHASLLPRWRGAAPIRRAIMAGDTETGVTIMQMDEGLDTGPTLLTEAVPITPNVTGGALHDKLAALSARLLVEAVDRLSEGRLAATPQPDDGATYATKIEKREAALDWRMPAPRLARLVRAFAPHPGTWFTHDGARIKILAAEAVSGKASGSPGEVLDARLTIACGDGTALRPTRLQRAGKAPVDVDAFLRGFAIAPGTILPCHATD